MKTNIIILFLLLGNLTFAANYYIDPGFSGPHRGTITNPYNAISQIPGSLTAGDTVFIKKGSSSPGNWYLSRSGSFTHPIVYTGYGTGALPTLTYSSGNTMAIHLANVSYVVIDGLKITDSIVSSDVRHKLTANIKNAIYLEASTHCTVKNCDISLVAVGVSTGVGSDYTTITHNHIYNLRMDVNTPTSVNNNDDHGANGVGIESSNNTITYNLLEDNWAVSYDYGYDGGAVEFYGTTNNNVILFNITNLCNGFIEIGSAGSATSNNNIIAYNKIINCGDVGWFHTSGKFGTSISNLQFYNNNIVQTSKAAYATANQFLGSDGSTPTGMIVLKNNIFWTTSRINLFDNSFGSSSITHSNNMYHLSGGVLNITLAGTESNITTTPWTNTKGDASTWDYTLPVGSAAINYGTSVSLYKDLNGNSFTRNKDAGAVGYINSSPPGGSGTDTTIVITGRK